MYKECSIVITARYHATLLSRIAGIFNKRRLDITALQYHLIQGGKMEMTLKVELEESKRPNLMAQLNKQVDILKIQFISNEIME